MSRTGAPLTGGEVAAHPAPQVAAGADVEHLVARPAEQVHARCGRHRRGQVRLRRWRGGGPVRRGVAGERQQLRQVLHADVADPLQQPVQHLDGGAGVGERTVGRRGGGAEQPGQRAQPHAGRLVAGSTARASRAVQSTGGRGQTCPCRLHAARRKPASKGALCATSTAPVRNSRSDGSTTGSGGAPVTIAVVMPVRATMLGGTPVPGSTSVANSPSRSPPRTLTAPISVMASRSRRRRWSPGRAPRT